MTLSRGSSFWEILVIKKAQDVENKKYIFYKSCSNCSPFAIWQQLTGLYNIEIGRQASIARIPFKLGISFELSSILEI